MIDPPILDTTVIERSGPQSRLLVLLHGYGERPEDLTERLHLLDPDGHHLVIAPTAPFARKGRPIWHRAFSIRDEAEQQYLQSLSAIDALLGDLERETGLPATEAVVGGFSQGGGLGLGLLLGAEVRHRPAAAFGVCSFPPPVRGFRVDRAAAANRPFLLSSARQDHFAPIEVSRAGAALLRETGLDVAYAETPGDHEMTDDAALQVGAWLASLGSETRPPASDLLAGVSGHHPFYADLWDHTT